MIALGFFSWFIGCYLLCHYLRLLTTLQIYDNEIMILILLQYLRNQKSLTLSLWFTNPEFLNEGNKVLSIPFQSFSKSFMWEMLNKTWVMNVFTPFKNSWDGNFNSMQTWTTLPVIYGIFLLGFLGSIGSSPYIYIRIENPAYILIF